MCPGCLQYVEGADNVDSGTENRVGLAERDLEPGQVDDAPGAAPRVTPTPIGQFLWRDLALDLVAEEDPAERIGAWLRR